MHDWCCTAVPLCGQQSLTPSSAAPFWRSGWSNLRVHWGRFLRSGLKTPRSAPLRLPPCWHPCGFLPAPVDLTAGHCAASEHQLLDHSSLQTEYIQFLFFKKNAYSIWPNTLKVNELIEEYTVICKKTKMMQSMSAKPTQQKLSLLLSHHQCGTTFK